MFFKDASCGMKDKGSDTIFMGHPASSGHKGCGCGCGCGGMYFMGGGDKKKKKGDTIILEGGGTDFGSHHQGGCGCGCGSPSCTCGCHDRHSGDNNMNWPMFDDWLDQFRRRRR